MGTSDSNQILDADDLAAVLEALAPFHTDHGLRCGYDCYEGTITIEDPTRLTEQRLEAVRAALPMGWEADWHPECKDEHDEILLVNLGAIADTLVRGLLPDQQRVLLDALERGACTLTDAHDSRPADLRLRGVMEWLRGRLQA